MFTIVSNMVLVVKEKKSFLWPSSHIKLFHSQHSLFIAHIRVTFVLYRIIKQVEQFPLCLVSFLVVPTTGGDVPAAPR